MKLLTIKEVMAELRIGRSTVWKWVKAKKLTVVKLSKRKTLFPAAEIARMVADRTRKALV